MNEVYVKFLWILTYAFVVGGEKENDETAMIAANTAVIRYKQAWHSQEEEPEWLER